MGEDVALPEYFSTKTESLNWVPIILNVYIVESLIHSKCNLYDRMKTQNFILSLSAAPTYSIDLILLLL